MMPLFRAIPILLAAITFLVACPSNSNDPYWKAYELFRDTRDEHPEDREFTHPDFIKVIEAFQSLPDKGSDRWVKAQRIAQDIEDTRIEGLSTRTGAHKQIDITQDDEASEINVRSLLELDQAEVPTTAKPTTSIPSSSAKAGTPPVANVPAPAAPKPPPPPCEDPCFATERQCKIACGCEAVGEKSVMCNLPEKKASCPDGCTQQRQACVAACSS
jgi:hypothetical protein